MAFGDGAKQLMPQTKGMGGPVSDIPVMNKNKDLQAALVGPKGMDIKDLGPMGGNKDQK